MNFMKKIFSIKFQIIIGVFLVILFILLIFIISKKNDDVYKYLINSQDYYIESKEEYLNLDIYSNHLKDYYLEEDSIVDAYIISNTNDFKTSIILRKVEEKKESITYKNDEYHCYKLEFKIPFNNIDLMQINDVTLRFKYPSNESLDFFIGNIIMYKNKENSAINIKHLKGIVNNINDESILVGIGLTIESNKDLKITNIVSLNERVMFQKNNIMKISDTSYINNIEISTLLGYKYDITYFDEEPFTLDLISEEVNSFIIPLSYIELSKITTLAFDIEYKIDGISYTQTISPFKYYKSLNQDYQEVIYDPNKN